MTTGEPDRAAPTEEDGLDAQRNELLSALWERHHGTNAARVEALESAALALVDGNLPPSLRKEAKVAAHKLAGSLGTFGFDEGTSVARTAEALLDQVDLDANELSQCVVALIDIVGVDTERDPTEEEEAPAPFDPAAEQPAGDPELADRSDDPGMEEGRDRGEIVLVTSDSELLERLQVGAAEKRRRLLCPRDRRELRIMLLSTGVRAILVDLELPAGYGTRLIAAVSSGRPGVTPLALSANDTLDERIDVARAGGMGFLMRSTQANLLLDMIDDRVVRRSAADSTIVAIDDDPLQLALLGALLKETGFDLVTTTDAVELWEVLDESPPAAVLLDLEMPDVDGLVLCRTIRAEPKWHQLPILVLATRTGASTVEAIFAAGADDYLVKPLDATELQARLTSHVERHRLLSTMVGADPLTGVSNRRLSEERLQQLLRLAGRRAEAMSLAIVQVDQFARISRRVGRGTGDTILRGIVGRLSEHLRDDDVIGRWSGVTFVLGLYGAESGQAVKRLQQLVERLAEEPFAGLSGQDTVVTFSAGVAEFPVDGTDLTELFGVAERVLQRAKGMPATVCDARSSTEDATGLVRADVVIVDDDEVLAELLVHSFETGGHVVRCLSDGIEAAELLGSGLLRARVVLLDVGLPGMDGFSLLRLLRDSGVLETTSVVMLTARSATSETLTALELGAVDYVSKPFSVPVLMERIDQLLERSS
jgi:diguanylate cyclase (GGDEF)-like protein